MPCSPLVGNLFFYIRSIPKLTHELKAIATYSFGDMEYVIWECILGSLANCVHTWCASNIHSFQISALDDRQCHTPSSWQITKGKHDFTQVYAFLERQLVMLAISNTGGWKQNITEDAEWKITLREYLNVILNCFIEDINNIARKLF